MLSFPFAVHCKFIFDTIFERGNAKTLTSTHTYFRFQFYMHIAHYWLFAISLTYITYAINSITSTYVCMMMMCMCNAVMQTLN